MPRILVVTDRRFWRRSIGSEQRIAALVRFLARRGLSVVVAYVGRIPAKELARVETFRAECPGLEITARSTTVASLLAGLRRIIGRLAESLGLGRRRADIPEGRRIAGRSSPERSEFVQRMIRSHSPDVVMIEFLRLAYTIAEKPRSDSGDDPFLVIDTIDVLHRRAERYRIEGAGVEQSISEAEEVGALAIFDLVLAIQSVEGDLFRRLLPDKEVLVVPHGIEMPALPARDEPATSRGEGPIRIGFLGGRDEANLDSISWFVNEIWPGLRAEFADKVELHVAGYVCDVWTSEDDGVVRLGTLESVDLFWPGVDLAINPVRFGSGLKIKNVEALVYGRPLVTTSVGAEGLEEASPEAITIVDSKTDWISTLRSLLQDHSMRRARGLRGRRFAEKRLSEEAAFGPLARYLEERSR